MESSDSKDSSIEEEQNEKCAAPPSHPYWRKNTNPYRGRIRIRISAKKKLKLPL